MLWRRLTLRALALACVACAVVASGCGGATDGGAGIRTVGDTATGAGADAERETVAACGGCGDGTYCDPSSGRCVSCFRDEHCGAAERCLEAVCVAVVCEPGETTCEDGVERRCDDLGTGWDAFPCAEGHICVDGTCRQRLCEPGATRCSGGLLATCVDSGMREDVTSCDEGMLCVPGEGCQFVRHDLMIIVDTSGSMRKAPGEDRWPGWDEPWPTCEPFEAPATRIGIARQLFRRLMLEEDAILSRSDFALTRFPQFVDGIFVKDPDDPGPNACDGGLWQSGARETVVGDDGAHVTGGEGADDWFAASVWQAVLVPDSRAPGFAAMGADARKEAILRYMDGVEEAVPGDDEIACTPDAGTIECGMDRACLGPEGARTCHDVSNPELRAMGQTPLGRSLFYAAEYYRRFVRVEGRPCATDADCGSSNYACEGGACSDPLARCRKTVVVLITDGTENPVPEDRFFRARIQAKRMHFGLGCADDGDCLGGATCETVRYCLGSDGVYGGPCDSDAACCAGGRECDVTCAQPVDVCATPGLLVAAADDPATAAAVAYVDPEEAQRVEYGEGASLPAPLPMTVHVVDVAGGAEENRRIALLGGGVLLQRSLDDLDALIEDLRSVFDIKAGAQCLAD